MSIEAIAWASRQDIRPATTKFVLIALCNYCNDDGLAWPSAETLSVFTSMNIKTVYKCLSKLREKNLITDTGRKTGATWSVSVYRIAVPNDLLRSRQAHPKTGKLNKQAHPKTERSTPKNGIEAHPKTGDRTIMEPLLTNRGPLDKREGKTVALADHLLKLKSAIQNKRS